MKTVGASKQEFIQRWQKRVRVLKENIGLIKWNKMMVMIMMMMGMMMDMIMMMMIIIIKIIINEKQLYIWMFNLPDIFFTHHCKPNEKSPTPPWRVAHPRLLRLRSYCNLCQIQHIKCLRIVIQIWISGRTACCPVSAVFQISHFQIGFPASAEWYWN